MLMTLQIGYLNRNSTIRQNSMYNVHTMIVLCLTIQFKDHRPVRQYWLGNTDSIPVTVL